MVVIKLIGGLGNQMFQYALGRHLAEIHKTDLKLDISSFETYKLQKYSLGAFNIQEKFASQNEINDLIFRKSPFLKKLMRYFTKKNLWHSPTYIKEKNLCYNYKILSMPDNIYLDGSWQSEKYFVDIAPIIHQEFSVKVPQKGKDYKLTKMIVECNSINIHIRRNDYVTNPITNKVHGTCHLEYYDRCVAHLADSIISPHFFIFSDDPRWVRENLKLSFPTTYVDHNGPEKNFEDLRLMSQCKHHIIANSSFSWWGAWLSSNPNKIVMAPQKWYNDPAFNNIDLIPKNWIKM